MRIFSPPPLGPRVACGSTLAIGHRDVIFTLYVDISDDPATNRDKAIALAKEILKECD